MAMAQSHILGIQILLSSACTTHRPVHLAASIQAAPASLGTWGSSQRGERPMSPANCHAGEGGSQTCSTQTCTGGRRNHHSPKCFQKPSLQPQQGNETLPGKMRQGNSSVLIAVQKPVQKEAWAGPISVHRADSTGYMGRWQDLYSGAPTWPLRFRIPNISAQGNPCLVPSSQQPSCPSLSHSWGGTTQALQSQDTVSPLIPFIFQPSIPGYCESPNK